MNTIANKIISSVCNRDTIVQLLDKRENSTIEKIEVALASRIVIEIENAIFDPFNKTDPESKPMFKVISFEFSEKQNSMIYYLKSVDESDYFRCLFNEIYIKSLDHDFDEFEPDKHLSKAGKLLLNTIFGDENTHIVLSYNNMHILGLKIYFKD